MFCQWCGSGSVTTHRHRAKVINTQIDFPHTLYRCAACQQLSLATHWNNREVFYRAIAHRRALRSPIYVIVYPIACAWCGQTESMHPEDINATIANPISTRMNYDVYWCDACSHHTALSYLGELVAYPARADTIYDTLYHLCNIRS